MQRQKHVKRNLSPSCKLVVHVSVATNECDWKRQCELMEKDDMYIYAGY